MKPLEGRLTISRPQGGLTDGKFVRVAIRDQTSSLEFVRLEIPLADFADALMGLSEVECQLTVNSLKDVGKVRESVRVTFPLDQNYLDRHHLSSYDRAGLSRHMKEDPEGVFHKEGWKVSRHLGSQSSLTPNSPNGVRINTSMTRYVEQKEQE